MAVLRLKASGWRLGGSERDEERERRRDEVALAFIVSPEAGLKAAAM